MAENRDFDFTHLTAAERLDLAQRLWESVDEAEIDWTPTPEQCALLDRRLDDPDPGRPADEVFEEIRRELLARHPRAA